MSAIVHIDCYGRSDASLQARSSVSNVGTGAPRRTMNFHLSAYSPYLLNFTGFNGADKKYHVVLIV